MLQSATNHTCIDNLEWADVIAFACCNLKACNMGILRYLLAWFLIQNICNTESTIETVSMALQLILHLFLRL